MPAVTIRNLPDEIHMALKARALRHGRSTEAEIRTILEETVKGQTRLKVGSALAAFGRAHGGFDLDISRDQTPVDPPTFE